MNEICFLFSLPIAKRQAKNHSKVEKGEEKFVGKRQNAPTSDKRARHRRLAIAGRKFCWLRASVLGRTPNSEGCIMGRSDKTTKGAKRSFGFEKKFADLLAGLSADFTNKRAILSCRCRKKEKCWCFWRIPNEKGHLEAAAKRGNSPKRCTLPPCRYRKKGWSQQWLGSVFLCSLRPKVMVACRALGFRSPRIPGCAKPGKWIGS